jgi:hypothetical protein
LNTPVWRQRTLLGSLAVIVVLSAASAMDTRREPQPAARPRALPPPPAPHDDAPGAAHVELERLLPTKEGATEGDGKVALNVFRAMTWRVEPPPPPPTPAPKPAPPPPPSPPPMPFTFMGRYEESGARILMLVKGDRMYTVSEGEVIENTYRVERLAGGNLELTYLPLGIKQSISAGGVP